jgi:hypothetical protein
VIAVIACGARKAATPQPAKDLYVGTLFAKARAAVEALDIPWLILSAKHGLLNPEQVVEPYDQQIATANVSHLRGTLYRQVQAGMLGRGQVVCDFTPEAYHRLLSEATGRTHKFLRPVKGLGQGRCMHVYGLIALRGELVTASQVYGARL